MLNNYSYFLSLRKERLDVAESMSSKLITIREDNPTYLDTHGWVLYIRKKYKEAKVFLGKSGVDYEYQIEEYWEGNMLVVKIGKEIIESFGPPYVNVTNCGCERSFGVNKRGTTLNVEAADRGIACFGYASVLLDHWNGYVVKLSSENITGNEFFFYIFGILWNTLIDFCTIIKVIYSLIIMFY